MRLSATLANGKPAYTRSTPRLRQYFTGDPANGPMVEAVIRRLRGAGEMSR